MKQEIIRDIEKLKSFLKEQEDNDSNAEKEKSKKHMYSFQMSKEEYRKKNIQMLSDKIKKQIKRLLAVQLNNNANDSLVVDILTIINGSLSIESLDKLFDMVLLLKDEKGDKEIKIIIPKNIPNEIQQDMADDIRELEKTYNAGCFRAAVILCGRILETSLHRKYFDVTGNDILEKSPGIGLGKLIAKMSEKNISLDPGISQQIHLINQVRIYSVHKKHESFYPTKAQAYAMILYTMDIVEKIFNQRS